MELNRGWLLNHNLFPLFFYPFTFSFAYIKGSISLSLSLKLDTVRAYTIQPYNSCNLTDFSLLHSLQLCNNASSPAPRRPPGPPRRFRRAYQRRRAVFQPHASPGRKGLRRWQCQNLLPVGPGLHGCCKYLPKKKIRL